MPNLVQTFRGTDRFYSKFQSSLFRHGDDVCFVDQRARAAVSSGSIAARKIRYTASGRVSATTESVSIPHDFFTDMSVFATPDLGWRMGAAGKVLVHLTRNTGSTHRGVRVSGVDTHVSEMSRYLQGTGAVDLNGELSEIKLAHMIMVPTYYTLREGLEASREGRIAGFAISADVMVSPAANETFDIWFRRKHVGTIDASNNINTQVKVVAALAQQESN